VDTRSNEIENLAHAYRVLDVPHDASARAIKSSYRKLVKRWHPDRYKAGSDEHREATLMTSLLNAAYARIQDAPLRPGYATPFSTPRNQPIDPGAPAQPQTRATPFDAGWAREEYVVHDPRVTNAAFFKILELARREGAKDDAARPFDRTGFAVRFVCGALFGLLMSFAAIAKSEVVTWGQYAMVTVPCVLLFGLLSGFGGEKFWRSVRPSAVWWWGRWR
jgi:hypothetical protein